MNTKIFNVKIFFGIATLMLGGPRAASATEPSLGRLLVTQAALSALTKMPASASVQPLAAFYQKYRPYLEAHSGTTNSNERMDRLEKSRNYIDLDTLGTGLAFDDIPRNEEDAVKKYGLPALRDAGTAPWALGEQFQELVYAFQNRDLPAILQHSARINSYTYALHQPFHTTKNYNGQNTEQYGIHSRFEDLPKVFRLNASDLTPGVPTNLGLVPNAGFDWAVQAYRQVGYVLAADKAASSGPTVTKYEELFTERVLPRSKSQLSLAATDLASLYYSAWLQAGRPPLPSDINPDPSSVKAFH